MWNRMQHSRHSRPSRLGFTWIELIAILFAIAVLVALILPAIEQSREAARISTCRNNLKQFGLGLHNYHETMESFPYGCVGSPELPPEKRWSWYLCMGNYWGHYGDPLIDLERAWDDPGLRPLMLRTWLNGDDGERESVGPLWAIPILRCPSGTQETHRDGQPFTDYVGLAGLGQDGPALTRTSPHAGAWAYEMVTTYGDVTDGLSHSLFMMETAKDNGCWLAGGPATVRPFEPNGSSAMGRNGQFGGIHPSGGVTLFGDGGVRVLSNDIDPKALSALVTITGNEEIPKAQSE